MATITLIVFSLILIVYCFFKDILPEIKLRKVYKKHSKEYLSYLDFISNYKNDDNNTLDRF